MNEIQRAVADALGLDERGDRIPDGAELLDRVEAYLARFVSYPSEHARVAHALWIAHSHLLDAFESTPRLAALSPEPGSGKTRLLEASEPLVPRPLHSVNVTPAYLFRKVADEAGPPTILFDEIDTIFGPKAKDNEDIRGLLNAGHRRGATAGRCVVRGKVIETEELPAYAAVALAGLGDLPDTVLSRCVVIRMKRRAPHEHVEPFRPRLHWPEGHQLRDELAAWADLVREDLRDAWPEMPNGIEDRNADCWEALLAVADAAGGQWPERARCGAVALVAALRAGSPSLGIRLLADLRAIFTEHDRVALVSDELVTELRGVEDSPWDDIKGKPLNSRGLATRLRQYGITPRKWRDGDRTVRGYQRADLVDPWERYLPSGLGPPAYTSATSATAPQPEAAAALVEPAPNVQLDTGGLAA